MDTILLEDGDVILLEDADAVPLEVEDAKPALGNSACTKPPDGAGSTQEDAAAAPGGASVADAALTEGAAAQDADAEPTMEDCAGAKPEPPDVRRRQFDASRRRCRAWRQCRRGERGSDRSYSFLGRWSNCCWTT